MCRNCCCTPVKQVVVETIVREVNCGCKSVYKPVRPSELRRDCGCHNHYRHPCDRRNDFGFRVVEPSRHYLTLVRY